MTRCLRAVSGVLIAVQAACSSSPDPYENAPLVGRWREEVRLACGSGLEVPVGAASRIDEVVFRPDGGFSVTWRPFETYKDYWGTFEADIPAGSLNMAVQQGNYIPVLDLEGSYEVAPGGRLVLRDVWLGVPGGSAGSVGPVDSVVRCGHVLSRY